MSVVFGRCPHCGELAEFFHAGDGNPLDDDIVGLVMDFTRTRHLSTCDLLVCEDYFIECFMCGAAMREYALFGDEFVCEWCAAVR